jgi:hypothetical protein
MDLIDRVDVNAWAAGVAVLAGIGMIFATIFGVSSNITDKDAREVEAKTAVCETLDEPDKILLCMEKL